MKANNLRKTLNIVVSGLSCMVVAIMLAINLINPIPTVMANRTKEDILKQNINFIAATTDIRQITGFTSMKHTDNDVTYYDYIYDYKVENFNYYTATSALPDSSETNSVGKLENDPMVMLTDLYTDSSKVEIEVEKGEEETDVMSMYAMYDYSSTDSQNNDYNKYYHYGYIPTDVQYFKDAKGTLQDVFYNEVGDNAFVLLQNNDIDLDSTDEVDPINISNFYLNFGSAIIDETNPHTALYELSVTGFLYNSDGKQTLDINNTLSTTINIGNAVQTNRYWYQYFDLNSIKVKSTYDASSEVKTITNTQGKYVFTFTYSTINADGSAGSTRDSYTYTFYLLDESTYAQYPELTEDAILGSISADTVSSYFYNFAGSNYPEIEYYPNIYSISVKREYDGKITNIRSQFSTSTILFDNQKYNRAIISYYEEADEDSGTPERLCQEITILSYSKPDNSCSYYLYLNNTSGRSIVANTFNDYKTYVKQGLLDILFRVVDTLEIKTYADNTPTAEQTYSLYEYKTYKNYVVKDFSDTNFTNWYTTLDTSSKNERLIKENYYLTSRVANLTNASEPTGVAVTSNNVAIGDDPATEPENTAAYELKFYELNTTTINTLRTATTTEDVVGILRDYAAVKANILLSLTSLNDLEYHCDKINISSSKIQELLSLGTIHTNYYYSYNIDELGSYTVTYYYLVGYSNEASTNVDYLSSKGSTITVKNYNVDYNPAGDGEEEIEVDKSENIDYLSIATTNGYSLIERVLVNEPENKVYVRNTEESTGSTDVFAFVVDRNNYANYRFNSITTGSFPYNSATSILYCVASKQPDVNNDFEPVLYRYNTVTNTFDEVLEFPDNDTLSTLSSEQIVYDINTTDNVYSVIRYFGSSHNDLRINFNKLGTTDYSNVLDIRTDKLAWNYDIDINTATKTVTIDAEKDIIVFKISKGVEQSKLHRYDNSTTNLDYTTLNIETHYNYIIALNNDDEPCLYRIISNSLSGALVNFSDDPVKTIVDEISTENGETVIITYSYDSTTEKLDIVFKVCKTNLIDITNNYRINYANALDISRVTLTKDTSTTGTLSINDYYMDIYILNVSPTASTFVASSGHFSTDLFNNSTLTYNASTQVAYAILCDTTTKLPGIYRFNNTTRSWDNLNVNLTSTTQQIYVDTFTVNEDEINMALYYTYDAANSKFTGLSFSRLTYNDETDIDLNLHNKGIETHDTSLNAGFQQMSNGNLSIRYYELLNLLQGNADYSPVYFVEDESHNLTKHKNTEFARIFDSVNQLYTFSRDKVVEEYQLTSYTITRTVTDPNATPDYDADDVITYSTALNSVSTKVLDTIYDATTFFNFPDGDSSTPDDLTLDEFKARLFNYSIANFSSLNNHRPFIVQNQDTTYSIHGSHDTANSNIYLVRHADNPTVYYVYIGSGLNISYTYGDEIYIISSTTRYDVKMLQYAFNFGTNNLVSIRNTPITSGAMYDTALGMLTNSEILALPTTATFANTNTTSSPKYDSNYYLNYSPTHGITTAIVINTNDNTRVVYDAVGQLKNVPFSLINNLLFVFTSEGDNYRLWYYYNNLGTLTPIYYTLSKNQTNTIIRLNDAYIKYSVGNTFDNLKLSIYVTTSTSDDYAATNNIFTNYLATNTMVTLNGQNRFDMPKYNVLLVGINSTTNEVVNNINTFTNDVAFDIGTTYYYLIAGNPLKSELYIYKLIYNTDTTNFKWQEISFFNTSITNGVIEDSESYQKIAYSHDSNNKIRTIRFTAYANKSDTASLTTYYKVFYSGNDVDVSKTELIHNKSGYFVINTTAHTLDAFEVYDARFLVLTYTDNVLTDIEIKSLSKGEISITPSQKLYVILSTTTGTEVYPALFTIDFTTSNPATLRYVNITSEPVYHNIELALADDELYFEDNSLFILYKFSTETSIQINFVDADITYTSHTSIESKDFNPTNESVTPKITISDGVVSLESPSPLSFVVIDKKEYKTTEIFEMSNGSFEYNSITQILYTFKIESYLPEGEEDPIDILNLYRYDFDSADVNFPFKLVSTLEIDPTVTDLSTVKEEDYYEYCDIDYYEDIYTIVKYVCTSDFKLVISFAKLYPAFVNIGGYFAGASNDTQIVEIIGIPYSYTAESGQFALIIRPELTGTETINLNINTRSGVKPIVYTLDGTEYTTYVTYTITLDTNGVYLNVKYVLGYMEIYEGTKQSISHVGSGSGDTSNPEYGTITERVTYQKIHNPIPSDTNIEEFNSLIRYVGTDLSSTQDNLIKYYTSETTSPIESSINIDIFGLKNYYNLVDEKTDNGYAEMKYNDVNKGIIYMSDVTNIYIKENGKHTYCSNKKTITLDNNVQVVYCDCNTLGTVLANTGVASDISRHTSAKISDATAAAFDNISTLYTTLLANYTIDADLHEWEALDGSDEYTAYTTLFNNNKELFTNSNGYITKDVIYNIANGAIVGINNPYSITFGTEETVDYDDLLTLASMLMGYSDVDTFKEYATTLAETLANNAEGASTLDTASRIKYDGAIYTTNNAFVLPFAFENNITNTVVGYFIVDSTGNISMWFNDISSALVSTNYYGTLPSNTVSEIVVNGRCMLFETPSKYYDNVYNEDLPISTDFFSELLGPKQITKDPSGLIVAKTADIDPQASFSLNNLIITNVTPTFWTYLGNFLYDSSNKISQSLIYKYDYDLVYDEWGTLKQLSYDSSKYSTYYLTKDTEINDDGLYQIIVKYTYNKYKYLDANSNVLDGENVVFYQLFTFIVNNNTPTLTISVGDEVNGFKLIGTSNYTNNDVKISWVATTEFQNYEYISITHSDFDSDTPNFVATYNPKDMTINAVGANSSMAEGITTFTYDEDLKSYVVTISELTDDYSTNGAYKVRLFYGVNQSSYSTYSFNIDTEQISGLTLYSAAMDENNLYYTTEELISGGTPIQMVNKPFTLAFNEKSSGAKITALYYKLTLNQSNDYSRLLKTDIATQPIDAVTTNFIADGTINSTNQSFMYNYRFNVDSVGDYINSQCYINPSKPTLYMFYLYDTAGNSCRYFVFYDTTTPKYIISPDLKNGYNIINDATSITWGDYKAIKIKTPSGFTVDLSNYTTNSYSDLSDYTILQSMLMYINSNTANFKGTRVKVINGDYYLLVPLGDKLIENDNTNIDYTINAGLADTSNFYLFTSSPNTLYVDIDTGVVLLDVSALTLDQHYKIVYPTVTKVGEAGSSYIKATYTYKGVEHTIYGAYGEYKYYFTIQDVLGNYLTNFMWMNFDQTQGFAWASFSTAVSMDDIHFISPDSTYSAAQLYFSVIESNNSNNIPEFKVSYNFYDFEYKNNDLYSNYTLTNATLETKSVNEPNRKTVTYLTLEYTKNDEPDKEPLTYPIEISYTDKDGNSYDIATTCYPFSLTSTTSSSDLFNESLSTFKTKEDPNRVYSNMINPIYNTATGTSMTAEGLYIFKREYTNISDASVLDNDSVIKYYVYYVDRTGIINLSASVNESSILYNMINLQLGHGQASSYVTDITSVNISSNSTNLSTSKNSNNVEISSNLFDANKVPIKLNIPVDKYNFSTLYDELLSPGGTYYTLSQNVQQALNKTIYNNDIISKNFTLNVEYLLGNTTLDTDITYQGGEYTLNISDRAGFDYTDAYGNLIPNYLSNTSTISYSITHTVPTATAYGKFYGEYDYVDTDNPDEFTLLTNYFKNGNLQQLGLDSKGDVKEVVNSSQGSTVQLYNTNNESLIFIFSITNDKYKAQIDPNNLRVFGPGGSVLLQVNGGYVSAQNQRTKAFIGPTKINGVTYYAIVVYDNNLDGTKFEDYRILDNHDNLDNTHYQLVVHYVGDDDYYIGSSSSDTSTYYYSATYNINIDREIPTYNLTKLMAKDKYYHDTLPTEPVTQENFKQLYKDYYTKYNPVVHTKYNYTTSDLNNYFFAVDYRQDTSFVFEAIDSSDSAKNLYFRYLGDTYPTNYHHSITPDNYELYHNKGQNTDTDIPTDKKFLKSDAISASSGNCRDMSKYYALSYTGVYNNVTCNNAISLYNLTNAAVGFDPIMYPGGYYEIIEVDEADNYQVYGIYLPKYSDVSITYNYNPTESTTFTGRASPYNNPHITVAGFNLSYSSYNNDDEYLKTKVEFSDKGYIVKYNPMTRKITTVSIADGIEQINYTTTLEELDVPLTVFRTTINRILTDYHNEILTNADSYTVYGYTVTITFTERLGVNLQGNMLDYVFTYVVSGRVLDPEFNEDPNQELLYVTIPAQTGSTYIKRVSIYRFDSTWISQDNDFNGEPIDQPSMILMNGFRYRFDKGMYKVVTTDNFDRVSTYFYQYNLSDTNAGGTVHYSTETSTYENDGFTYTAGSFTFTYDNSLYSLYIRYIPEGNALSQPIELFNGDKHDLTTNSIIDLLASYNIEIAINKNTTTLTFNVDDITFSRFLIKTVFANLESSYVWDSENTNNDIVAYTHRIAQYTYIPNVIVKNLSGSILDTSSQLSLTEDFTINISWHGIDTNYKYNFNNQIFIERTYIIEGVSYSESYYVSTGYTITEAGSYVAHVENDIGYKSDNIYFTRSRGEILLYAVYTVSGNSDQETKLMESNLTNTYEDTDKINYNFYTLNTYLNFRSKDGAYIINQHLNNYVFDSFINNPVMVEELDFSPNEDARYYVDVRTNSNMGIHAKIVNIGNYELDYDKVIPFVVYKIYTISEDGITEFVYRYITIYFLDSTATDISNVEIYKMNDDLVESRPMYDNSSTTNTIRDTSQGLVLYFDSYYLLNGNRTFVDYYLNGDLIQTLTSTDPNDESELSITITDVGIHRFVLRDLAGHTHAFFSSYTTLYIYLINNIIYEVNEEEPINYQVFNGPVKLSISDTVVGIGQIYDATNIGISVYKNGAVYQHSYVEKTLEFTEPGHYSVNLDILTSVSNDSYKEIDRVISTTYNFTIINPNVAQRSFSIPTSYNFIVEKLMKDNLDYTDSLTSYNTLWLSNGTTGAGIYDVTIKTYLTSLRDYKSFTFRAWISEETPSIAGSIKYGEETTSTITIFFNPGLIYTQIGDSYIAINNVKLMDINAESINEVTPHELVENTTYYVQIYNADGQLISSYKFIKKEPLNSTAWLVIVIVVVFVAVVVVAFILLRRKAKIR